MPSNIPSGVWLLIVVILALVFLALIGIHVRAG
jgi:hypothetical protein